MKRIMILVIIFLNILIQTDIFSQTFESKDKFIYDANSSINPFMAITKIDIRKNFKGDKTWVELSSPFLGWAKIIGDLSIDATGDYVIDITSIKYLANWPNGWTSGINEATGKIVLLKTADGYKVNIIDSFEMWDVIKGEIRFIDDFYLEEKGIQKVKERMDRIIEYIKFMKKNNMPKIFGSVWFNTLYSKPFKMTLRKFLFGKETKYPDNLLKLKESGTVTRDYEEAYGLFFMYYNLDSYFNDILNNSILIKTK